MDISDRKAYLDSTRTPARECSSRPDRLKLRTHRGMAARVLSSPTFRDGVTIPPRSQPHARLGNLLWRPPLPHKVLISDDNMGKAWTETPLVWIKRQVTQFFRQWPETLSFPAPGRRRKSWCSAIDATGQTQAAAPGWNGRAS